MTTASVGVLGLQGDVREHLAALGRCGCSTRVVRSAPELAEVSALVIPGGESTTMSRLLRAFELELPLRRRLEAGLPCLATCAGLILLSRSIIDGRDDQLALGALDVAVRRNAYGRQLDSFEADLSVSSLGPPAFRGVFIRAPRLARVGDAVEVLASHRGAPVAVAEGPRLGLTFHPEMTGDDRFHRLFLARAAAAAVEPAA